MKLVKKVIIVRNGVPTNYLWTNNEEKRPILSVFSKYKNVGKNEIFIFFVRLFGKCFKLKLKLTGLFSLILVKVTCQGRDRYQKRG